MCYCACTCCLSKRDSLRSRVSLLKQTSKRKKKKAPLGHVPCTVFPLTDDSVIQTYCPAEHRCPKTHDHMMIYDISNDAHQQNNKQSIWQEARQNITVLAFIYYKYIMDDKKELSFRFVRGYINKKQDYKKRKQASQWPGDWFGGCRFASWIHRSRSLYI